MSYERRVGLKGRPAGISKIVAPNQLLASMLFADIDSVTAHDRVTALVPTLTSTDSNTAIVDPQFCSHMYIMSNYGCIIWKV